MFWLGDRIFIRSLFFVPLLGLINAFFNASLGKCNMVSLAHTIP